ESTRALAAIDQVLNGPSRESAEVPEEAHTEAAPLPRTQAPTPQTAETVRVSADHLDRLLRSTGQLLTETLRQNLVGRELSSLGRGLDALQREGESVRNGAAAALRQLAVTPAFARVARYINFAEEQVRTLTRTARSVRLLHRRSAWALQLLGGQLQQDARRVR